MILTFINYFQREIWGEKNCYNCFCKSEQRRFTFCGFHTPECVFVKDYMQYKSACQRPIPNQTGVRYISSSP